MSGTTVDEPCMRCGSTTAPRRRVGAHSAICKDEVLCDARQRPRPRRLSDVIAEANAKREAREAAERDAKS